MVQLRGGTGHKRGGIYGGKVSTRPASVSQSDKEQNSTHQPRGAVILSALLPRLTKRIFEQYGFSAAQLIADWPAIVGPELAGSTLPEKLKWPHGSPDFLDDDAQTGKFKQKPRGATLVLRVEGPRSLEVQFGAGQIIERINSFFGYCAVTDIRIIQAPVPKQEQKKPQIKDIDASDLAKDLPKIKDPALREALYRMAQGVKATNYKKN